MENRDRVLAIIPARAGSKGLEKKNVRLCAGKPLIAWTIEAALSASRINTVLVSTESEEIEKISREFGACVPFLRPAELATDTTPITAVIEHTVNCLTQWCQKPFHYVALLQPTSPLRNAEHIDAAVEFYFSKKRQPNTTLVSVYEAPKKVGWLMEIEDSSEKIKYCFDTAFNTQQRQELRSYYLPNGAIYFLPVDEKIFEVYRDNTIGYIMSREDSIDIDVMADLISAEKKLLEREDLS